MTFDAALEPLLKNLAPGTRHCTLCGAAFQIEQYDIDLLKKLRVPPPVRCNPCKRQHRLAFLNYTSLYKRKCDVPGHTEDLISSIPPRADFTVYDYDYWNTYSWDPFSYGETWNGGSFRDQFHALMKRVPQPALTRHPGSVGSDYTLYGFNFKNCYFTFGGKTSENVHYSNWPSDSQDSLDLLIANNVTLSSHGVFLYQSYKCNYSYFSHSCVESDFLYSCKNVQNSFGCVNLRNKQYCFFNEQLTKEEYEKRRAEINLGDRDVLRKYSKLFWDLVKSQPMRAIRNDKSENVSGNFVVGSKNCHDVVRALNAENVHHADFAIRMSDSMQASVCSNGELLYEIAGVATGSANVKFSYQSRSCFNSEFLVNCKNVTNSFGCVGLDNKQFCILNQQYTEEEYFKKVDEIKTAMLAAGEYGEFFPMSVSPYSYTGSFAGIVYPLQQRDAEKLAAYWYEEGSQNPEGLSVTSLASLPADIRNVPEDILSRALGGVSGKAFRLIPAELDFYKTQRLPLPEIHPRERMLARFGITNNFTVEKAVCDSCGSSIDSMYKKSDGYTIYCDVCYSQHVS